MGWWSSLFTGSNPTLQGDINQSGNIGGYASGAGMGDLSAGTNWMKSILSGDSGKIAHSLAPEISAQQGQVQQAQKTASEFGNRSGGTNSAVQSMLGKARGNIVNLVGNLQSGAATGLTNTGSGLLGTALNAYGTQADMSQLQMKNWENSIFGQGFTFAAGYGEGAGLAAI